MPFIKPMKPVIESKKQAESLVFNYKDVELLRRFMTESGQIMDRERTGLTAKQQRILERQIKRARHVALLPFVATL